jgi:hypothetical protein
MFLRLVIRTRNAGNLMSETKGIGGVPQEARTAQNEDAVFQAFKKDRTLSIRSIANNI